MAARRTAKRDDSKGKDGEGNVRAQRNQYRNGGHGPNDPSKAPGQTGPDTDPKTWRGGMRDGGRSPKAAPRGAQQKHSFEGRDAQFNPNAKLDPSRVSKRGAGQMDGLPNPRANSAPTDPSTRKPQSEIFGSGAPRKGHSFGDGPGASRHKGVSKKDSAKLEALLRAARKTK